MPVTDPVADMLTRIRNAIQVRHESVMMPHSKMKLAIAKILKEEGFIRDFDLPRGQARPTLRVHLVYRDRRTPAITGLSGSASRDCVFTLDVERFPGALEAWASPSYRLLKG